MLRQHTDRQISKEAVNEISCLLNHIVEEIVNNCEVLLQVNGAKNQRISRDLVKSIINSRYNYISPENKNNLVGGEKKEKIDNLLQLPGVEVQ